ncbi:hypothetical protein GCM10011534_10090 [Pseudooceanicola nanhaiensis]|uniref:Uncharacterized protein n=1 Tax=Pseudooceanicola nanhaiensis TaxID=375761 RepID=A0A917SN03_9RHOB|nr:hypothetical protein GCM10011534_10090 [Pseudooceanicola nanhaiensis]
MSWSKSRTALLIQKIDTSTSAKKPKSSRNCDSRYLSKRATSLKSPARPGALPAPVLRSKLAERPGGENSYLANAAGRG